VLTISPTVPVIITDSQPSNKLELLSTLVQSFKPIEIAKEICLVQYSLFKSITYPELLNQSWNHKTDKATLAPNILSMITHFNSLSKAVISLIVCETNIKIRRNLLSILIAISKKCMKTKNLNACMAFLAAFYSSPVHRLKNLGGSSSQANGVFSTPFNQTFIYS